MSKLTLSIDSAVVSRAKQYARRRGISVSGMVEAYLASVAGPRAAPELPPVLRSLTGILKRSSAADHKKHLARKYR